ncbi:hypothetical protein DMX04_00395 [Pseudomonas koreensis]|nr:hypothetical protein DMX04_00395 [Pseudomonas koreensis]
MTENAQPDKDLVTDNHAGRNTYASIDTFSAALIGAVLVALGFSIYFYRQSFSGDLSVKPEEWSAFGTYIGGLFGPLISFLTLIAILKTIGLQKELLKTQRSEFSAMERLQTRTLASQLSQIERADADADRRLIEESRLNVLRILDNFSVALHKEYETKQRGYEMLLDWVMKGHSGPSKEQITNVRGKLDEYETRLAEITTLYSELCFDDFADVASLKAYYQAGIEKIWRDLSEQS